MFSTDFIFRQQENLVDNQKCQAGFRPLCNKILLFASMQKLRVGIFSHLPMSNDGYIYDHRSPEMA